MHHLELQEVVNPLPGDRGFSGCLGTGTGGSVSPAEEPSLPSEVRGLCRARGMESRAGRVCLPCRSGGGGQGWECRGCWELEGGSEPAARGEGELSSSSKAGLKERKQLYAR